MRKLFWVAVASFALTATVRSEERKEPEKAPDFKVKDLDGKERTLKEFEGKIVVLEWTSHGCPYVKRHYDAKNIQGLQKKYMEKGVIWLTICSSGEGREGWMKPEAWKEKLKELGSTPTAVLLDGSGEVGKLYGAKTTPNFCIIDGKGARAYDGAIDDNRRAKTAEEIAKSRCYVSEVLDALLAGKESPIRRTDSYG
jgi:hypothetical protein